MSRRKKELNSREPNIVPEHRVKPARKLKKSDPLRKLHLYEPKFINLETPTSCSSRTCNSDDIAQSNAKG